MQIKRTSKAFLYVYVKISQHIQQVLLSDWRVYFFAGKLFLYKSSGTLSHWFKEILSIFQTHNTFAIKFVCLFYLFESN